jgi:tRNA-dihydrouridine synthase
MSFWNEIEKPIFALAPMEDVTDTVFRELVMRVSVPGCLHVVYTEFTNIDGMNHSKGREKVGDRLIVNATEDVILKARNIKLVAQVWGKNPEIFQKVVKHISEEEHFDGIDINMGCPVKKVVKNGCCSALIGTPNLAKEIILATKEATHLPVSVKTRTGLSQHTTENWISNLIETKPAAIILHGRTQKQQSEGEADWEQISLGVKIRKALNPETVFIGNGDVMSYSDAIIKTRKYGVDGVMIGRGIFHNPWFFSTTENTATTEERIELLLQHARLYFATWNEKKNFNILKRFFKIYISNFAGASELRNDLMHTNNLEDVMKVVGLFLRN